LSVSVEAADTFVFLEDSQGDEAGAEVAFVGLVPGLAGLYQLNFTLPPNGVANGDALIFIDTDEGLNGMSTIRLSGFTADARQKVHGRGAFGRRSHRANRARPACGLPMHKPEACGTAAWYNRNFRW